MAALFVVWGYSSLPRIIRLLGRGGQTETVEWGVYLSMLFGFPLVVLFVALVLPRRNSARTADAVKGWTTVAALLLAIAFVIDGRLPLLAWTFLPAVLTVFASLRLSVVTGEERGRRVVVAAVFLIVALASWMMAGSLVYWDRGTQWFLSSPIRLAVLAIAAAVAFWGLPAFRAEGQHEVMPGRIAGWIGALGIALLVLFSFRTNPVVEFYHWGFWIGPMEQLRQGGALLQDTPSQYGLLSILIPTAIAGSAWQAFWFFQGFLYALVAVIMFVVLRRLRAGPGNVLLALGLVFTTLFFRPRDAALILPAQMTPSGGPVRFIWCFVLLGYLLHVFHARTRQRESAFSRAFPWLGHVIWLCAVAWSFETAIYCSAIWFPAFGVYLLQHDDAERNGRTPTHVVAARIARGAAVPLLLLLALYGALSVTYRGVIGSAPDLTGYFEYGLLYSRGFGALPIATAGIIWYLLLVFFIASSVVVLLLVEEWRSFGLVVAAGAWGATWSVSSYFVSRSHPVNLLSIAPVLLFALAVLFVVVKNGPRRDWEHVMRVALIPLFAMPMALTLGHPGLWANLRTPQLSPSRVTDQVPLMEPELEALMRSAGATPRDPVVRVADGRLMLPAWREVRGEPPALSHLSWLPKPYEIIGSLPPERRQVYIDRAARNAIAGWMINHQTDTVRGFKEHLPQILRTHAPARQVSSGPWTLWWMAPR